MGRVSVSIVLLCEDTQTDSFVRRFLSHRGFHGREIKTLISPPGRQSGEQWIRTRYPVELRAIRAKQQAFLLVVVDADTQTTRIRRSQLDLACDEKGVARKTRVDPVIIAVPRRNIETWFAFLNGQMVDEATTYPRLRRQKDCRLLARELYRMCHEEQRLAEPAPPSLKEACQEYQRLRR